jgi:hypothetical protein
MRNDHRHPPDPNAEPRRYPGYPGGEKPRIVITGWALVIRMILADGWTKDSRFHRFRLAKMPEIQGGPAARRSSTSRLP